MTAMRWALPVGLASAVAGCSVPEVSYTPIVREVVAEVPVTLNRDLDLLLVIDNSITMAANQERLVAALPLLIERLNNVEGGLPNIHIGVVNTDMGTQATNGDPPAPPVGSGPGSCADAGANGILTTSGSPAVSGAFLSDIANPDGSRTTNYSGSLVDVVAQMIRVGSTGCGFEQPLHAMRAALENDVANAGFLRSSALLGVVFVTDEDDCSVSSPAFFGSDPTLGPLQSFRCTRFGVVCDDGGADPAAMNAVGVKGQCHASPDATLVEDVAAFRDFLVTLKGGDPSRVAVAGLFGDPEPVEVTLETPTGGTTPEPTLAHSCTFAAPEGDVQADPAVRMRSFFDLFPDRASSGSICEAGLNTGVDGIGKLLQRTIGTPCLTELLRDVDDATPGLQPDCLVEDIVGEVVTPIVPCEPDNAAPCWRLEEDLAQCEDGDHLKLVVDRVDTPPAETVTRMSCQVQ